MRESYASRLNRENTRLVDVPRVPGPQYPDSPWPASAAGYRHTHLGIVTTINDECHACHETFAAGSRMVFDYSVNRVFCLDCAPFNEFTPDLTDEQTNALAAALGAMVALATAPHKHNTE